MDELGSPKLRDHAGQFDLFGDGRCPLSYQLLLTFSLCFNGGHSHALAVHVRTCLASFPNCKFDGAIYMLLFYQVCVILRTWTIEAYS